MRMVLAIILKYPLGVRGVFVSAIRQILEIRMQRLTVGKFKELLSYLPDDLLIRSIDKDRIALYTVFPALYHPGTVAWSTSISTLRILEDGYSVKVIADQLIGEMEEAKRKYYGK